MPKKSALDTLLETSAMIGGGWLAIMLIKAFGKEVYKCPNCKNEIEYHAKKCTSCNADLNWKV
jgi:predicted RNA-binding Zn-ribbon protein involved in translation (DUF1610 family)